MYELFYYFWLVWSLFIGILCFMETSIHKYFFLIILLSVITFTNVFITVYHLHISLSFSIVMISSILIYVQNKLTIKLFIATFITMLSYISAHLWDLVMPMMFTISIERLFPIIIVTVVMFLINSFIKQLSTLLIGVALGKFIFDLIMISYNLNDTIGSNLFISQLSMIVITLLFIHFIKRLCLFVYSVMKQKFI